MGYAFTAIKGLTFYDMRRAFNGLTLVSPVDGTGVWLVDMFGKVANFWDMGYKPGTFGQLLPNGQVLYHGKLEDGPLARFEGAGGILIKKDWGGNKLWEYKDPYLHHGFWPMKNGNILVLKWVEVPENIAKKVKYMGSDPVPLGRAEPRKGLLWGDAVQEITPEGKVVWEWIAHEHLDTEVDLTCPICPPDEWTHANSVGELPDGNIMVSFMETNTIVIVDKHSGDIKWRFSKVLRHHHYATVLDEGNILVFDNDHHGLVPRAGSRVLELSPKIANPTCEKMYNSEGAMSNAISWSYIDDGRWLLYSGGMASCQRLPNGNTLICEGTTGRILEVTPNGELVWEFVNNLPSYETSPTKSRSCMVYAAFRYGVRYSGLKRKVPLLEAWQAAPDMVAPEEKEAPEKKATPQTTAQARLRYLGY